MAIRPLRLTEPTDPSASKSFLAWHWDARRFRHGLLDRGHLDDPLRLAHGLPGHRAFDHRCLGHTAADLRLFDGRPGRLQDRRAAMASAAEGPTEGEVRHLHPDLAAIREGAGRAGGALLAGLRLLDLPASSLGQFGPPRAHAVAALGT